MRRSRTPSQPSKSDPTLQLAVTATSPLSSAGIRHSGAEIVNHMVMHQLRGKTGLVQMHKVESIKIAQASIFCMGIHWLRPSVTTQKVDTMY